MGSACSLQAHLQTCVNIQLQTGGVRKSRPFLNNQLNSQLARLQAVGVRKSRPFLKNQHGFSAATSMCVSPASDRGGQEVPTLFEVSETVSCMSSDRRRQEVPTLLEESACVQHSQVAGASSASDCEGHEV